MKCSDVKQSLFLIVKTCVLPKITRNPAYYNAIKEDRLLCTLIWKTSVSRRLRP